MKNLIAVVGMVLCMVACSQQSALIGEGRQSIVAGVNYTIYSISGPEMLKHGIKCASVNGNSVTFWKDGGCEFNAKQMDELSDTELDLIKIKDKLPPHISCVGENSVVIESGSENYYIEVGHNSSVSIYNSSNNHIVVGDNADATLVNSNANFVKVENGQTVYIADQQRKDISYNWITPLDKSLYGNKVEYALIHKTPESKTVEKVVELADFVAFQKRDGQVQMKPIECLDEEDKKLLKAH